MFQKYTLNKEKDRKRSKGPKNGKYLPKRKGFLKLKRKEKIKS